jgi:hypothetical protein
VSKVSQIDLSKTRAKPATAGIILAQIPSMTYSPCNLWLLSVSILAVSVQGEPPEKSKPVESTVRRAENAPGTLWREPTDIGSRDLFYGPGGERHQPSGKTFTFVDEDTDGSNPKYNVRDSDGVKWKIKLGAEARPETAASRLVWAAGYFTNEDYFLPELNVTGLPAHLHRGQDLIGHRGEMHDARLKRHLKGEEKIESWRWHEDSFSGTREWNGLRVLMALINNWDLKDENNGVFDTPEGRLYLVSDLGASFGTTGYDPRQTVAKGNLHSYEHSHFITKERDETVSFGTPSRPAMLVVFNPIRFTSRMNLRWIGHGIPRDDARWMGELLGRLSQKQIRDAFRAAGYSPDEAEGYARVVEKRIALLRAL